MTKQFIEKVIRNWGYSTERYEYRVKQCYDWNLEKPFLRISRIPSYYMGTTAMLDRKSWQTVLDIYD